MVTLFFKKIRIEIELIVIYCLNLIAKNTPMLMYKSPFSLKKQNLYILLIVIMLGLVSACSTKKNTWQSRKYQELTTRFNVFFNGKTSYKEGLEMITNANEEDYSGIIPMYPISHHKNATAASSNMDRTIEKSRKAIKLHSIKVKPEKNYKKANDPDYKLFYNQEEFNPALKDAWLTLGMAEFHKADFLGSVGTFSYVARHYSGDKNMVAKCQLWMVRAYAEMGWIYEAEQMLSKVEQDNLKQSSIGLFASVNADLLLKKKQYKEAIPFLELALAKEKDTTLKQRFYFILAQLYHKNDNDKLAYETYSKVIKMNPPYEMDFNARINRAQLNNTNTASVRKELNKMLRNSNNKEYLDQIYFALGNSYFHQNDTVKAIENYILSAKKSTRNGIDKAVTLITLGDLYYQQRNYVEAQPSYDEASKILSNEHYDYARVTKLAEMLGDLVIEYNVVLLQDSLQRLAKLPENERLEVVSKIIKKIYADEKLAEEEAKIEDINRELEGDMMDRPPIGMNPMGGWYFYNTDLLKSGQAEFIKRWGRRKLEDNWRRANRTSSIFSDDSSPLTPLPVTAEQTPNDSTTTTSTQLEEITDNKKPEFYLRQIPVTPQQIQKSNIEIADALYTMGIIYKDKIEDYPMATKTFEEYIQRFSKNEKVVDAYFNIYLIQTRLENTSTADFYRNKILMDFPDSKYKEILSQPDYAERLEQMNLVQDSIYQLTYAAYIKSDFNTVNKYVASIRQSYPSSTLMPKFLFLNALSIGKNESQEKFKTALDSLVSQYPQSEVSAMSKDILALMKQGMESKTGKSGGTLLTMREETTQVEISELNQQEFSTDKTGKHRIMMISNAKREDLNKLQYNLASFNFSRFMIKDFDLTINKLDSTRNVLSITNFESYEEAQWYLNSISSDISLMKLKDECIQESIIVSETNYALLRTTFTLQDYYNFKAKQKPQGNNPKTVTTKPVNKNETVPPVKTNKQIPAQDVTPKQVVTTKEKTVEKTTEVKVEKKNVSVADTLIQNKKVEPVTPATKPTEQKAQVRATPVPSSQPKIEDVPLFKNLFAYRANEPHYVAIYIVSGTIDFEKIKTAIDAYNAQNYPVLNLKVSLETFEKQNIIIIGSLSDAQVGKSYLLRMVKENSLFASMKGIIYRNLLGSQQNLNVMMQNNALATYFEFMQEYYLK